MSQNGLRLLSIDSGGVRSLSQLKIMESIVHRIKYDRSPDDPDAGILPCECFDAMGGSDTGGLIAIMFCKLRMSVEDTIEEFYKICQQVYVNGLSPEERTTRLKECVEDLLGRMNLPLDLKMGKDDRVREQGCPCFVVTTPKNNIKKRSNLRTYYTRAQLASKATVVEAILATCATQPDFLPVSIGHTLSKQDLIGGVMSTGNPCRELISEAYELFGKGRHISTILSLGSGVLGTLSAPEEYAKDNWINTFKEANQDCDNIDQEIETQVGHLGAYYRFSVDQGLQRMYGLNVEEFAWINTQTESYMERTQVSQEIDHCVESLRLRQGQVTLEELRHIRCAQPIYKSIPPLSSYFVLRTEPWKRMITGLINNKHSQNSQRILVISGMGGCGKTQLAIHFINEYKSRFKHSFFIDGSSRESIQADLINHIRTASSAYSQASFSEALSFFCTPYNQPSLLIYDNVDDINLNLASLLPDCNHGAIIITTRNRSRGQLASPSTLHIELDVMSPEEAVDVVIRSAELDSTDRNIDSVSQITSELGCLPVALIQAGTYIHENMCTAEEYLERLRNHKSEMMYTPAGDRLQRSSYAAFDISYDRLPRNVQNFLHLIGCVHFTKFPLQIIVEGAKTKFTFEQFQFEEHDETFDDAVKVLMETFCPSGKWDSYTFDRMTRILQNYSLASFTRSGILKLLQMHPLIHEWAFGRLKPGRRILFLRAASRLIATSSGNTTFRHYLPPHIDALDRQFADTPPTTNTRAAFGHILMMTGRSKDSRVIWEHIYCGLVNHPESSKLHVATAALELASTYDHDLGKMETLEKEAIRIRAQVLGPDHLETLDAKKRLAGTYEWQERLEESEFLYKEVLKMLEHHLGNTHERVLEVIRYLGDTLSFQGRHSEAEALQKRVFKAQKEQLGDTHMETLGVMSDLASTYYSQGRYAEAEELHKKVLKAWRKQLGEAHLDTLRVMNNLALAHYSQGCNSEAEELQEQVLKIRKEQLGETHLHTVTAMSHLALTYHSQGHYSKAETLQDHVLKVRKEQLGNTHSGTVTAMSHLGVTYHSQCRHSEAETLQEQVLKMWKRQLGSTHLNTLLAMNNLAWTYYCLGRLVQAKELATQAEKAGRDSLGVELPYYKNSVKLLRRIDQANASSISYHSAPCVGSVIAQ